MEQFNLPNEKLLVAYWLKDELPKPNHFACPPLKDIAGYTLPNGNPQILVVSLFAGEFKGDSQHFNPPYITLPDSIQRVLNSGDVAYLQSKGIKVTLSVVGSGSMGWSCIPKPQEFARWVKSEMVDRYHLDGIDIDDEYANCQGNPQQLVDAVKALRAEMPNHIISKALWSDHAAFQSTKLADLLTFGCTMGYGDSIEGLEDDANRYLQLGLPRSKLCVGVQAGPSGQSGMTSLQTTSAVTQWAMDNHLLGMMLFSYSQDIQQFTFSPQHSKPYPSPDDHLWQRVIVETVKGTWFDDTDAAKAANSPITKMRVRCGDVLNAIQATNGQRVLPQHGGSSGGATEWALDKNDRITQVSGYIGTWYGWTCVAQLTLKTRAGKTYGPFGSLANVTAKTPFSYTAGANEHVLAFYGSTVNVPLADGSRTDIINSLGVSLA